MGTRPAVRLPRRAQNVPSFLLFLLTKTKPCGTKVEGASQQRQAAQPRGEGARVLLPPLASSGAWGEFSDHPVPSFSDDWRERCYFTLETVARIEWGNFREAKGSRVTGTRQMLAVVVCSWECWTLVGPGGDSFVSAPGPSAQPSALLSGAGPLCSWARPARQLCAGVRSCRLGPHRHTGRGMPVAWQAGSFPRAAAAGGAGGRPGRRFSPWRQASCSRSELSGRSGGVVSARGPERGEPGAGKSRSSGRPRF